MTTNKKHYTPSPLPFLASEGFFRGINVCGPQKERLRQGAGNGDPSNLKKSKFIDDLGICGGDRAWVGLGLEDLAVDQPLT